MTATPPPTAPPTGYPAYPAAPTNSLAIASLVLSAVGLFTFVTAIAGVVCGHLALGQIARTGEQGRGLALAGVIGGYIVIGMFVFAIILTVIVLFWSLSFVQTLIESGVTPTPRP